MLLQSSSAGYVCITASLIEVLYAKDAKAPSKTKTIPMEHKEYIIDIEKIAFSGKGLGHAEGKTFFVPYVLPGETVHATMRKKRKGVIETNAPISITTTSTDRIAPRCKHFTRCGGCSYQHIPYDKQLEIKTAQITEIFRGLDLPKITYPLSITGAEHTYTYRNKVELSFGFTEERKPVLGFHTPGRFYDIEEIMHCDLISERANRIIQKYRELLFAKELPVYRAKDHSGELRHLVIREGYMTGEIMVNLVVQGNVSLDIYREIEQALRKHVPIESSFLTINTSISDNVQVDSQILLSGNDHIKEKIGEDIFSISPISFFQTNSHQVTVLYDRVRSLVAQIDLQEKHILELYSGTGTISIYLADMVDTSTGVELVPHAVDDAHSNAALNGKTNVSFIAADVLDLLKEEHSVIREKNILILDPPRAGIHPKALKLILERGWEHVVYVSCNPTTLRRDIEEFGSNGYEVVSLEAVDMFPQTYHIEMVCYMRKV